MAIAFICGVSDTCIASANRKNLNLGEVSVVVEPGAPTRKAARNPLAKYAVGTTILAAFDMTFYAMLNLAIPAKDHVSVFPRWLFDAEMLALMSLNLVVPLSFVMLLAATLWSGRFAPVRCVVAWPRSLSIAWYFGAFNLLGVAYCAASGGLGRL